MSLTKAERRQKKLDAVKLSGKFSDVGGGVITVRLAPELHHELRRVAHGMGMSLNGFCVAALEFFIDDETGQAG